MRPIYIPSKGRPESTTAAALRAEEIPYRIVVEPQDEAAYRPIHGDRCLVLPMNDQGIAFVRNFIKDFATTKGEEWYWTIDDDLKGITQYVEKKNVKVTYAQVFREAEKILYSSPLMAMVGLEYAQLYWAAKKETVRNSFCEVFVCINTLLTKRCAYDASVNTKEDRDFCMQVLSKGWETARWTRFGFACPSLGKNEGGLQKEYQSGRHLVAIERMLQKWPGITQEKIKPNGMKDLKINWAFFRPKK